MRNIRLNAIIERDENGYYAHCPEMPGCQTEGATFEEALSNLKEAAELYLETLTPDERAALSSRQVFTTALELKAG